MSHLLLIEDDEIIGENLQTVFEESGYQVTWLQRGEVAKQAVLASRFDLVILDLTLPKVSGLEILKSLRAGDKVTPVIVITANDCLEER